MQGTQQLERIAQRWLTDSGERVRTRRVELKMQRSTLAHRAGTTEATIHRIEHGANAPRDVLKLSIAQALGVQPGDLWPPIELPVAS